METNRNIELLVKSYPGIAKNNHHFIIVQRWLRRTNDFAQQSRIKILCRLAFTKPSYATSLGSLEIKSIDQNADHHFQVRAATIAVGAAPPHSS